MSGHDEWQIERRRRSSHQRTRFACLPQSGGCWRAQLDQPVAFLRLATAVVIESHDEWQATRRYLSDVSMDELRSVIAAKHAAAGVAKNTKSP